MHQSSPPSGQSVTHGNTYWRAVALAAQLSFSLGACGPHGDDCLGGEARCDGSVAVNCEFAEDGNGSYHTWSSRACGDGACEVDDQGAFCALNDAPDRSCDTEPKVIGINRICIATILRECRSGYATATYDCATGASTPPAELPTAVGDPKGPFCVSSSDGAFCAASP